MAQGNCLRAIGHCSNIVSFLLLEQGHFWLCSLWLTGFLLLRTHMWYCILCVSCVTSQVLEMMFLKNKIVACLYVPHLNGWAWESYRVSPLMAFTGLQVPSQRVRGEFWGSPRVLFTTLYAEILVYTFSQNLHNPICSKGEKWHWFSAYVGYMSRGDGCSTWAWRRNPEGTSFWNELFRWPWSRL